MTPEEFAEKLVRAAHELTGAAEPRYWWVYLGRYCVNGLPMTRAEAELETALLRDEVAAIYREAVT